MKSRNHVVHSALASVLALGTMGVASDAVAKEVKMEKCYGVAKAGKNDCQTSTSACAETSKVDGAEDAWIYLPEGTCKKIVGGSLKPSA